MIVLFIIFLVADPTVMGGGGGRSVAVEAAPPADLVQLWLLAQARISPASFSSVFVGLLILSWPLQTSELASRSQAGGVSVAV